MFGTKLIGKLSKGYRQRVGLAQAIIHNPEVLILDEPTAGLDPKQIIETRELIHSLAGDHTIILSTHILPEVEHTCEQVIIINKGKAGCDRFGPQSAEPRSRRRIHRAGSRRTQRSSGFDQSSSIAWKCVSGVSRVLFKESSNNRFVFEVESLKDRLIRGDLARAVVEAGWNLNELRPSAMSLEEIFLQLTGAEKAEPAAPPARRSGAPSQGEN